MATGELVIILFAYGVALYAHTILLDRQHDSFIGQKREEINAAFSMRIGRPSDKSTIRLFRQYETIGKLWGEIQRWGQKTKRHDRAVLYLALLSVPVFVAIYSFTVFNIVTLRVYEIEISLEEFGYIYTLLFSLTLILISITIFLRQQGEKRKLEHFILQIESLREMMEYSAQVHMVDTDALPDDNLVEAITDFGNMLGQKSEGQE